MCFTIDQIEQACGLLLLTEFSTFLYCCKKCPRKFETGSHLEVHILSEHQDNKEAVFVHENVFVDDYNVEPTMVKIEPFDPTFDEAKPLTVLLVDRNLENGNNSIESSEANDTISSEKTNNSEEKNDLVGSDGDSSMKTTYVSSIPRKKIPRGIERKEIDNKPKRSRGRPAGSKNKKTIINKLVKESIPKKSVGRPVGTKNPTRIRDRTPKCKFYCDMCPDLSFNYKESLKRHMAIRHVVNKMKRCEICNKFPRKSYEHHMKMKHSDHRFKCDHCDATFTQNTTRVIHMRTHTGEKPFLCSTCGKAFHSKSRCSIHEDYVHKTVKKFQCEHCDRSFNTRGILQDHINGIHTKERPHVCDICGKNYASKSTLQMHKSTHGEARLKCRYCDMPFKIRSNRWKHEMVFHKKVVMVGDKIMNMYKKSDRLKMEMLKKEAQK